MIKNIFVVFLWMGVAALWVGLFQAYGVIGALVTFIVYFGYKKYQEKKRDKLS